MTTVRSMPEVPPPQRYATNCTSTGAKSVARNHSENDCTRIVPNSSALAISDLRDATPHVLTKTRSLLVAVSKYLDTSNTMEKRHSPDERNNCCLCHNPADDSDPTAIRTLEELKAFVHDVAEMLRPVQEEISTLKTGLEKNSREQQEEQVPRGMKPVALQAVSGDLHVPDNGTFMSPGNSSVLTSDSHFPTAQQQHGQLRRRLPMLVKEFPVNSTGGAESGAEPNWYSEKMKEKNREIEALQATLHDLVGYQQKITVEFDKVKHHLCTQGAQQRALSSSFYPDGRPTLYLPVLESTFEAAVAALDQFTSHFVAYSEARLHVPANKIWKPNFRKVYLAKESHWTYALKAFFCEKMFVGFENESFMTDAASLYLPDKLRKESYAYFKRANAVESTALCDDAHFRTYCEQKFCSIIPDAVLLEPGDYDENDMGDSSFPTLAEINLSKSFTVAAMKVWTLHKLCFSVEPAVNIFRVRRELIVDWNYMESVVRLDDDERFTLKVGFMIAPGFRVRNSIVKSQIYLASKAIVSHVGIHMHLPV